MPAKLMMMRCHLLGSVQASETLQYRAGEKQRKQGPHFVDLAAEAPYNSSRARIRG